MSPKKWDKQPWWLTAAYIKGLEDQGVLGKPDSASGPQQPTGGRPGNMPRPVVVDFAEQSAATLPKGFTTRRAG